MKKFNNICWYTNLPVNRKDFIELRAKYAPDKYPSFDNYEAINVERVKDIPCDYEGVMGVPMTALDKLDWESFEIVGITDNHNYKVKPSKQYINLIQHGGVHEGKSTSKSKAFIRGSPDGIFYTADNAPYPLKGVYPRLLIKRR